MFELQKNDKFSFLAVERCAYPPKKEVQLSDGTYVLTKIPGDIGQNWKRWIGETRSGALDGSNCILLRRLQSAKPEILDEEHEELLREVTDTFWLLQLSGVVYYQSASSLQGSVESDGYYTVRQMIQLRHFYVSDKADITHVTIPRLEEAVAARRVRETFRAADTHCRFRRGLKVLTEGLWSKEGSERLHQAVRALEAVILPPQGETKKKFVSRCKTFVKPAAGVDDNLARWFDMRSDVEHVHELERSLQDIPNSKREQFAIRCTRQAMALASFAYRTIFRESSLHPLFETDDSLAAFWKLPEDKRNSLWPWKFDLSSI